MYAAETRLRKKGRREVGWYSADPGPPTLREFREGFEIPDISERQTTNFGISSQLWSRMIRSTFRMQPKTGRRLRKLHFPVSLQQLFSWVVCIAVYLTPGGGDLGNPNFGRSSLVSVTIFGTKCMCIRF